MKRCRPEEMVFAMIAGCATLAVGMALALFVYQAIGTAPSLADAINSWSTQALKRD